MIDREHELPITKQCHILELSRSSVYYMAAPVNERDAELMRAIDEIHLEEPYLGSRGMKSVLRMRSQKVGRIHVRTLMRKIGIEALYKQPRLSKPHPGHTVYPYLLRNLDITEANSVWCSDITYIPMAKGFCYLVAIMDLSKQKSVVLEAVKHIGRVILRGRPVRGLNKIWNT
jgi:putative transposase